MKHCRFLSWLAILLLLAGIGTVPAAAQPSYGVEDNFLYELLEYSDRREVRIVEYIGSENFVVVPSQIDGAPVTELGPEAFESNYYLDGILLPDTLEVIGDRCFYQCLYLEEILLPKNIKYIGALAFYNCRNLSVIKFPGPIDTIGYGAFEETIWRMEHSDWMNRIQIWEITNAQQLSDLLQDSNWSRHIVGAYERHEVRVLNDIDCTGVALRGNWWVPCITGYDQELRRPVQRTISNAVWELEASGGYYHNFQWKACALCEENDAHDSYDPKTWTEILVCNLHSNCEEQCADCYTRRIWQANVLPAIDSDGDMAFLSLENCKFRIAPQDEAELLKKEAIPSVDVVHAGKLQHVELKNIVYEGCCNEENVQLACSDWAMQDVKLDGLRMTMPAGREFGQIFMLTSLFWPMKECMASNIAVDAPVQHFIALWMDSYQGNAISNCLVSGIALGRVKNAFAGIGINGLYEFPQLINSAVHDLRLESLDDGGCFCAVSLSLINGSMWGMDCPDQVPSLCTKVVLDVDHPLLSTPIRVENLWDDLTMANGKPLQIHLQDVYYTSSGRSVTLSEIWPDMPKDASFDGLQAVSPERLRSQELLDALNQPIEPGFDKTTSNRWSRGDSYCDGCPVPAACSPIAPPAPAIPYGDVDESGKIDASDALCILQASVRLRELSPNQAEAADVNGDYRVDAADALLVLQRSVRLIDRFPMD